MPLLRDQIMARFWEAANTMAGYSIHPPPQGPSHAPAHAATAEAKDCRSIAMQELLARQARALAKLHEAVVGAAEQRHDVDEELLWTRLDDLASISTSAFYAYRFDLLPYCWRQIYTDTLIAMSHYAILQAARSEPLNGRALDLVVENLDRALITAGGAGAELGRPWIETTLQLLDDFWRKEQATGERPCKRARTAGRCFSVEEPFGRPLLSPAKTCPHHENWTLGEFEAYMSAGKGGPSPIVFADLAKHWPALTDRPWSSPDYLLSKTFGGRRLVPVEVGRSYVDEGWGQELIPFKAFLARYLEPGSSGGDGAAADPSARRAQPQPQPQPATKTGYLAQHNLFQQIPSLRSDIQVPDFCWADVPGHPADPSKNQPPVAVPQLNAWLGPARTITPLHTDGYHNLLCQVVGTKYVRLYPPSATPSLRPRGVEHGVDMSNTSALDVGVLEGWDPEPESHGDGGSEGVSGLRESLRGVHYWECILAPGDTLLIPIGWWHYVRSLSISFSVSFWWN